MPLPFALGAHPSPPDPRDARYHVANFLPPDLAPLPQRFDLRPAMQPVRHQGAEGSCTGHAVASGLMGQQEQAAGLGRILSTRDAYTSGKKTPADQEGAVIRDVLQNAKDQGICLESDWPYHPHLPGTPGPLAAAHRAQNRLKAYSRVGEGVSALKTAMHTFGPAVVCIPVTDGFWEPDASGRVANRGALAGYHAVTLAGWDDSQKAVLLRNSWGADWGMGGYCWYPYELTINEAWVATQGFLPDGTPAPLETPWWAVLLGLVGWKVV